MKFIVEKETFLNKLKIVEKATVNKGIQPVLSNVLLEAFNNQIKFTATDLDMTIVATCDAQIENEGKITLPAKKLFEIISKLPEQPVCFELNQENQTVKITCANSAFEVYGISAEEFPLAMSDEDLNKCYQIEIDSEPFVLSIKKTAFAAANFEMRNVISGVFCSINENVLEMAATDGNRLAQNLESIKNEDGKSISAVVPSRTLQEVQRIYSLENNEVIEVFVENTKIVFKLADVYLYSRLLEGQYPPYKQLIPKSCAKTMIVEKEKIINSLELVSTMVSEKMNIVKFYMNDNKLCLKADTPSAGMSEDIIDVEYLSEEMTIAFNYKYVLDCLKVMDCDKVEVGLNGSLSASLFKPVNTEGYLCLVMPIQIKQ